MKRILPPLLILLAYLTVVGMGATFDRYSPLSNLLDLSLLAISVGLGSLLSVLVLIERFGHGRSSSILLLRLRRWWVDDRSVTK